MQFTPPKIQSPPAGNGRIYVWGDDSIIMTLFKIDFQLLPCYIHHIRSCGQGFDL